MLFRKSRDFEKASQSLSLTYTVCQESIHPSVTPGLVSRCLGPTKQLIYILIPPRNRTLSPLYFIFKKRRLLPGSALLETML